MELKDVRVAIFERPVKELIISTKAEYHLEGGKIWDLVIIYHTGMVELYRHNEEGKLITRAFYNYALTIRGFHNPENIASDGDVTKIIYGENKEPVV